MADYTYTNETGVIEPNTADVLTDVAAEYTSTFGSDLVTTGNTPQGILINAETLARESLLQNNATLANQINPNLAGGIFLDAIAALFDLQRAAATYTEVSVTLTGVSGTIIPALTATAQNTAGQIFYNQSPITLVSNTGSGVFIAQDAGPITVPANTLTGIVNGVPGWETINNSTDATEIGSFEQSDESFRRQRIAALGLQGLALPVAIQAGLANLSPLISFSFRENVTSAPIIIDGIILAPHSIYVCVSGINSIVLPVTTLAVATILLSKKSAGAGWNGSTTVNVTDPVSGQIYPVSFDLATEVEVLARVTVRANSTFSSIQSIVQNAILAYAFGNLSGEKGFVVNNSVSAFELAGAINQQYPAIFILNLEITKAAIPIYTNATIPILINEIAFIQASGITVDIIP